MNTGFLREVRYMRCSQCRLVKTFLDRSLQLDSQYDNVKIAGRIITGRKL
jgi:hypothetical protein